AARVLRKRETEELGVGQLGPQCAVEAVGALLDLLHPLDGRVAGKDLLGQIVHRLLLLGQREVHQPAGWNWGRIRSSSNAMNSTSTGMPTCTSDGSTPTTFETRRVPSSSWTSATTNG